MKNKMNINTFIAEYAIIIILLYFCGYEHICT